MKKPRLFTRPKRAWVRPSLPADGWPQSGYVCICEKTKSGPVRIFVPCGVDAEKLIRDMADDERFTSPRIIKWWGAVGVVFVASEDAFDIDWMGPAV